jgi:hypothetical protein
MNDAARRWPGFPTPRRGPERAWLEFRQRWQRGDRVRVEVYLEQNPELANDVEDVLDLILEEFALRTDGGESPTWGEYLERFPGLASRLEDQFDINEALSRILSTRGTDASGRSPVESVAPRRVELAGYEVLGELGRGGMGVVYKARQVALDRLVALKLVLAGGHAEAVDLARFKTEAEAIARLQHPYIVQIHEIGEHHGLPYFVLEYCSGGSLADQLDGTPRLPGAAAQLVEVLAGAMHAVHQQGIIHRDLKPANVLLAADGTPRITDFGLAKRLDGGTGPTTSGAILGTPSYIWRRSRPAARARRSARPVTSTRWGRSSTSC